MKKVKIIVVVIVAVIAILGGYGLLISEQSFKIGECSASFSSFAVDVEDPSLCPTSGRCRAPPELQQYNAAVDVILCACESAKEKGYQDTELNTRIQSMAEPIIGSISAQLLCESPSTYMTKRAYE